MTPRTPTNPKDMRELPLCHITWRDAASAGRWRSLAEARKIGTVTVQSVGWLTKATRHEVQLAQSIGSEDDCNDLITVPRSWVLSLTQLRPGRRKRR